MRFGLVSSAVLLVSVLSFGVALGQRPVPEAGGSAVTLTPSPVVFAETSPGQVSSTMNVTVKNPSSTVTVTVGAASVSGNPAQFAIAANTCGSSLTAGATCVITLDFAPTGNGPQTATLTVVSQFGNGTATLNGQAGMATFSPSPVTFPATTLGQTSATQLVTLTNNSTNVTTLSTGATVSAGYSLVSTNCTSGRQLSGGGGLCTATVAFSPTAIGTQNGTLTVTDDIGTQTAQLSGVGLMANPAVTVFPAEAVGSTESANVTFTFGGPGTVSSFNVVTQGSQSLDFAAGVQAGSGYCRPGAGTYATGSTCTVTVNFKPITPGLVTGAVYLYDNETTPQLIGIGYMNGTGTGPMAALYPGTQTTLFAGTAGDAFGLAVDLNGDVFYDNSNVGNVTKQTFAQSAYTATTLGSGLGNFSNFAIDGAGYVFMTNSGVIEQAFTPSTTSYTQSTAISGVGVYALAIDGSNNLYVAAGNTLYKETPSGGSYTGTTISTSFNNIIGLAVDSNKNVYLADAGNAALYELPYLNGSYASSPTTIATGLGNVNSVSVDAAGTVYTVADGSYTGVLRYAPASGGGFTALPVVGSFSRANGVALDRHGNVYVTDDGGGQQSVNEINVNGAESFTFASTVVGTTSATQTATLVNTGNTPMTVTGLTFYGPFSSSTTLASCATLAPGATCAVPITFAPTTTGTTSGTLVFTDNTLGAAGTTQTVNLTGTGTENLVFTTAPPTSLQTGQNAGTVVVSVEKSTGAVDTTQTPSVTLTVTGPSYTQTYTVTAVNGVVTFDTSANALTATGVYGYAAAVSAGNYNSPTAASETVYPYKLATTGVVTPQTASNATTNSVTVSVVTNSGAATTQTNAITLKVTGPNSYSQSYGPFAASASTGAYTFTTAALTAAGTYSYAATSTASPDGVAVTAAPTVNQVITASSAMTYTVTPASTTAVVGYADNITVTAYDTYGNVATNYAGTAMLTSTDTTATLPTPFTLASGTATKPVTFNTLTTSGWTVTAMDTVTASITGTSAAIPVQPVPSFVVTSSAGDTSGACTSQTATGATADSACTVYAAFAAVTALNNASLTTYVPTITFAPALTATGPLTITMLQPISATGNVSLIGPGAVTNSITLSGNNAVTFLAAGGTAVTNFTGLTFANFKGAVSTVLTANGTMTFTNDVFTGNNYTSSSNNGGVLGINGNITVTGCTFTNNVSAGGGGALASTPTAMVINNSLFSGNTAASYGGAYYSVGTGPVTITNTVFVGNRASSSFGGAVYINSTTSPLTVTNGTFNTNTSTIYGGAIYTVGPYTISNSSFTGNSASGIGLAYGGAIYATNTGAANSISSTNFIGNFATTTSTTAYGGALFVERLNLTNVLFSGNYLKSSNTSYGGAVYLSGAYTNTWTGVTLTGNCTVPPSTATPPVPCAGTGATNQYGGAVFQATLSSVNNLYNVTITGNSSKIGGGWERYNGTLNTYNTVISGNATTGTTFPNTGGGVTSNNSSYIDTTTSGAACSTAFCTPVLSALGSYGGGTVGATVNGTAYTTPVQTIVPLPGSPLLVAGSLSYVGSPGTLATGATVDARGVGYPRTTNGKVDIGAVQSNYSLSFVTQPGNTAVNAALLPPPTVQLYESGVPFTAGAGQTLSVAAQSGQMFTTAADSTAYSGVTLTASGLESVAPYFSTPQADDALVVSVKSGSATPVTVASTTSGTFNIGSAGAASIAFATAPKPTVTTGGNAGIVQVALTNAGGATNTAATAAVTLTVTGPSSYSQSYGPTAAVNGVVSFDLSGVALTTAGSYTYTASAAAYTTDTVVTPETVGGDSVWVLDASGVLIKLSTAGGLVSTVGTAGTAASYGGAAFDNAGDLWSVNGSNNALTFVAAGSTAASAYTGGGLNAPVSVAVDGAGYVWVANSGNNTVSEFTAGRGMMSPTAGYGSGYSTGVALSVPSSVAIDVTGGVWVANKNGNSVTHIFGAATPVVTPLSAGTQNGTLASKP